MRFVFVALLSVLALVALSGCAANPLDPLIGTWHTEVLGFDSTMTFTTNGTGSRATTLGTEAFEYNVINSTQMNYREMGDSEWDVVSYQVINQNTLVFNGTTYTRVPQ